MLKVQDESKFQGWRQFQGKETSGGHQDGQPVKDCFCCSSDHDLRQCGFPDKNCFHCGQKGEGGVLQCCVNWKFKVNHRSLRLTQGPLTLSWAMIQVKRIFGCCVLYRSKVKIRSFTGHSVQVLGTMDVNVKVRDRLIEARIIVTEYQHNLLGRDLIDKQGVLTINLVKDADTDTMKAALDRHPKVVQGGVR